MTTFLFLDFDGVINDDFTEKRLFTWPTWHRNAGHKSMLTWVCPKLIQRVEGLRAWADADVVISSTWRHYYSKDELRAILAPIPAERIIGVTPSLSDEPAGFPPRLRGREIARYLATDPCDRFVILDDMSPIDFLSEHESKLVRTEESLGVTEADIAAAKKCLDSQAREVKVGP